MDIHGGVACEDRDLADGGLALAKELGKSIEGAECLCHTVDKRCRFDGARQMPTYADGLSFVIAPRFEILELESACEDCVVADFKMSIKGEMGGV